MSDLENAPKGGATSSLYCSIERHLWKGGGVPLALYNKMYALSLKNGGLCYCSVETLAEFLGCSYNGAWISVHKLIKNGFLIPGGPEPENEYQRRAEEFDKKNYHVVSHKEWAKAHPGKCITMLVMPWNNEIADPLARRLYAASGGKTKWYAGMLKNLRKTGWTDDEIVKAWQAYLEGRKSEGRGKFAGRGQTFEFMRQLCEQTARVKSGA